MTHPSTVRFESPCSLLLRAVCRVLCVLAVGFSIGCSSNKTSDIAATQSESKAKSADDSNKQQQADDELTKLLEPTEAKTVTNAAGQVTSITFADKPITPELAKQIGSLGKNVKKLAIYKAELETDDWAELGKLNQLEHLDLRDCPLDNPGLIAVASNKPKLRSLRLSGKSGAQADVDDDGFVVLKSMPELKVLAADYLWLSEDGLAHLSAPEKLSELYAAKTLIDDFAMEAIAKMTSLKKLRLAVGSVTADGLRHIEELKLEELDLSECASVGDDCMPSVAKLTTLRKLNLWRTVITDSGCLALAPLKNLVWLNVDNTTIGNASLDALAGMQQLQFLHLGSTGVTDEGMKKLTGLTSLKDLIVTRTAVTQAGLEPVREALPAAKIQTEYLGGE